MGLLASFLENRKSERPPANSANSANLKPRLDQNSQLSQLSQAAILKTEIPAGRKFAEFASFAALHPENQICQIDGQAPPAAPAPVASLEERRASVKRLLDAMGAENERRGQWWAKPVEGWRDGRLELRSAVTGETTVIRFPKGERDA
jgi:hypothetical protein